MNIYSETKSFKPTFLYIKQHSVTGLLYFGKTVRKDPEKYMGSGVHWTRHIEKHGKDHVVTLWYCLFYDEQDCKEFAINFSKQQNIVESNEWANMKIEELDGGDTISCHPERDKIIKKTETTIIERYGSVKNLHTSILPSFTENIRNKNDGKVGGQIPGVVDKSMITKFERYGDENYNNVEKNKQTKMERYGDENYNNPNKAKNTLIEKYGSMDEAYVARQVNVESTFIRKYGKSNPLSKGTIPFEKKNATIMNKYGVSNVFQCEEVKLKIKIKRDQRELEKHMKMAESFIPFAIYKNGEILQTFNTYFEMIEYFKTSVLCRLRVLNLLTNGGTGKRRNMKGIQAKYIDSIA